MFTFNLEVYVCLNSTNSSGVLSLSVVWTFSGYYPPAGSQASIQILGCCFVVNPAYFMVLVYIKKRIQPTSKLLMLGEEEGGNWKWKPQLLSLFFSLPLHHHLLPPSGVPSPNQLFHIPRNIIHPSLHTAPSRGSETMRSFVRSVSVSVSRHQQTLCPQCINTPAPPLY